MSRRFALPIAITLSAHAILLLGSSRPVSHPIPKTKEDLGCPLEIVPLKDVEIDDANVTEVTKGSKDIEAPPSLPPPTPQVDVNTPFPITEPPAIPFDRRKGVTVIPPGRPGAELGESKEFKKVLVDYANLDNHPRTKFQASPQYPYALKASGITGNVMVEFTVDETGRVLNPHVLSSSHPEFEAPSLRAVQTWRFEPGKHLGKVVRFRMSVPIQFSISD
jgi:protein TonB